MDVEIYAGGNIRITYHNNDVLSALRLPKDFNMETVKTDNSG